MTRRYFLVCCLLTSCLVAGQSPRYALLGQTVNLNPGISRAPDEILWKQNGNKVVEFDGNEEKVFGSFDNRITLDWHTAELNLEGLRHEDSGEYVLEVYTNQLLEDFVYELVVLDKVAKPIISCERNNGSSSDISGNQATLTCSAASGQSPSLMKFEWSSQGNVHPGPKLTIPLGDEHDNEVYNCTASNPLTKDSTIFSAHDCYPDKLSAGGIAGICIAIVIGIIAAALSVLFCKWKRKACFGKERRNDEEQPDYKPKAQGEDSRLLGGNYHEEDQENEKGNVKDLIRKFENHEEPTGFGKNEDMKTLPPSPQARKPSPPLPVVGNKKEDTDEEQLSKPTEETLSEYPLDSEKANDGLPGVLDRHTEDTQSESESPTASEPPGSDNSTLNDESSPRPDDHHDEESDTEKGTVAEHGDLSENIEEQESTGSNNVSALNDESSPRPDDHHDEESDTEKGTVAEHGDLSENIEEQESTGLDKRGPNDESSPHLQPDNLDADNTGSDTEKDLDNNLEDGIPRKGTVKKLRESFETPNKKDPTGSAIKPEAKSDPAKDASPPPHAALLHSPLTPTSTNTAPKDGADDHGADADSDPVTGEPTAKTAEESDSSGSEEENKSDSSSTEKDLSNIPEKPDEETTSHESDVSEDNKASDGGSDEEEIEDKSPSVETRPEPESPIPSKPDDSNTSTCPESPDIAGGDPDEKEKDKSRSNSQSDSSSEETDKAEDVGDKNEVQSGPEEEKAHNESLSEDKEELKKRESVE